MPAIATSYARLSAVLPSAHVSAGPPRRGRGWLGAAELAAGGPAVEAYVAANAKQLGGGRGAQVRPDVAATLALHRYLWPAALLFTVPWFLSRRVPRLPVGDVSFHTTTGRMTVQVREFACLPEDPAAALPGARVVASPDELRAEVRAAVAEHATPLLAGFAPLLRRGPRALWGLVTDEIAEGLSYVAELLGERDRAVAELGLLLPGGTKPLAGGAHFRHGPDGVSRTRETCCLYYTIDPAGICSGCPRACERPRIGHPANAA
jgi:hypothetical protein